MKRRDFLAALSVGAVGVGVSSHMKGAALAASQKPNILFIFLDDFGWKDTGYMGSDFFETPHIDRLASEGAVFTNAYSCAANCAPARACLLSGQYTPRHEIYNVGTGPRGKSEYRKLLHVPGVNTLDPEIKTWAHLMQDAGYVTATMGKWHLSPDPIPYGFDVNVGGTHSGGPPKGYYPPHGNVPGLEDAPEGEYVTDRLSDEAVKFIRNNKDNPWCLYLTHFAVHSPFHAKKELLPKYESKKPGDLHDNVIMATMIQAVDDGVGKIRAVLDELGIADNTIVVFFSDNGGVAKVTDMEPLRGDKGTYYEGGIREPFFIKWPGVVKPGTKSDVPIIGVDLYPTFCEMAGAKLPGKQLLDGVSLVPLLDGRIDTLGERALFWHFPAYLQVGADVEGQESRDPLFRTRPCSIIRLGDWKLHQYFEDGGLELYNLKDDVSEKRNLAREMPEKTRELLQRLERWRKKVGAPVPSEPNPEYDAAKEAAAIKAGDPESKKKK
jgi:arylsulfatase A-like enzyme